MRSHLIVCLGCGCHNGGSQSRYCCFCEKNTCSACNGMGIKSKMCIQCRRARGSKE